MHCCQVQETLVSVQAGVQLPDEEHVGEAVHGMRRASSVHRHFTLKNGQVSHHLGFSAHRCYELCQIPRRQARQLSLPMQLGELHHF